MCKLSDTVQGDEDELLVRNQGWLNAFVDERRRDETATVF